WRRRGCIVGARQHRRASAGPRSGRDRQRRAPVPDGSVVAPARGVGDPGVGHGDARVQKGQVDPQGRRDQRGRERRGRVQVGDVSDQAGNDLPQGGGAAAQPACRERAAAAGRGADVHARADGGGG
ncbi:hypothetical protein IWQ57_005401, partial [Coemansia nantahalensis]